MEAVIEALTIIMRNNVFTFGDTRWRQTKGTAMGTPPAPPYVTIFFGIHEDDLLPEFDDILPFYRRFIDDVFGIWLCHPDPAIDAARWAAFGRSMNYFHGLEWEISERTTSLDYMDLQISIVNNKIITDLYEKDLNLYLYILPHSAHPPGVLTVLVLGCAH